MDYKLVLLSYCKILKLSQIIVRV